MKEDFPWQFVKFRRSRPHNRAGCTKGGSKSSFFRDLRIAARSLAGARGLWITVALTLALGISANAAIFSVVRGVLLRPLVNREEGR